MLAICACGRLNFDPLGGGNDGDGSVTGDGTGTPGVAECTGQIVNLYTGTDLHWPTVAHVSTRFAVAFVEGSDIKVIVTDTSGVPVMPAVTVGTDVSFPAGPPRIITTSLGFFVWWTGPYGANLEINMRRID